MAITKLHQERARKPSRSKSRLLRMALVAACACGPLALLFLLAFSGAVAHAFPDLPPDRIRDMYERSLGPPGHGVISLGGNSQGATLFEFDDGTSAVLTTRSRLGSGELDGYRSLDTAQRLANPRVFARVLGHAEVEHNRLAIVLENMGRSRSGKPVLASGTAARLTALRPLGLDMAQRKTIAEQVLAQLSLHPDGHMHNVMWRAAPTARGVRVDVRMIDPFPEVMTPDLRLIRTSANAVGVYAQYATDLQNIRVLEMLELPHRPHPDILLDPAAHHQTLAEAQKAFPDADKVNRRAYEALDVPYHGPSMRSFAPTYDIFEERLARDFPGALRWTQEKVAKARKELRFHPFPHPAWFANVAVSTGEVTVDGIVTGERRLNLAFQRQLGIDEPIRVIGGFFSIMTERVNNMIDYGSPFNPNDDGI